MGIEELTEKLQKFKKKVIEKTDKGIRALKGSPDAKGAAETGKEVLKEVSGLKARLIKEGANFARTYMKENVTQDNSTGATIGALGEYLVKKTAKGVKVVADALTDYIEKEAKKYHRIDTMPELNVVKELINQYAEDQQEMGKETLNYKGIGIVVNKTEKDLSITLTRDPKIVSLTYLLKDKKITDLNKDFETLTADLVKRLDRLSDPTMSMIDKTTTFKILQEKGEQKYLVHMKKENEIYDIAYTPENRNSGIILKYVVQKPASEPEVSAEDSTSDILKEK